MYEHYHLWMNILTQLQEINERTCTLYVVYKIRVVNWKYVDILVNNYNCINDHNYARMGKEHHCAVCVYGYIFIVCMQMKNGHVYTYKID